MNQLDSPYRPLPDNKTQMLLDAMSAENQQLLEQRQLARMFAVVGWILALVSMVILFDAAAESRATADASAAVRICVVPMTVEMVRVERFNPLIDVVSPQKNSLLFQRNRHDVLLSPLHGPFGEARSINGVTIRPYAIVSHNGDGQ